MRIEEFPLLPNRLRDELTLEIVFFSLLNLELRFETLLFSSANSVLMREELLLNSSPRALTYVYAFANSLLLATNLLYSASAFLSSLLVPEDRPRVASLSLISAIERLIRSILPSV